MSIRKTVQELRGMAENLEASGFENGQAQSTIEAIAVSIERFAVTPEVLARELAKQNEAIDARITRQFAQFREEFDRRMAAQDKAWNTRFAEQNNAWDARFAEQNNAWDARFAEQNNAWDARFAEQKADLNRQFTELRAAIKTIGTRQFAMMWGVIVMMLGLLATNFVQQVL